MARHGTAKFAVVLVPLALRAIQAGALRRLVAESARPVRAGDPLRPRPYCIVKSTLIVRSSFNTSKRQGAAPAEVYFTSLTNRSRGLLIFLRLTSQF